MKTLSKITVLFVGLFFTNISLGQNAPVLTTKVDDLLKMASAVPEPIGYKALAIYNERKQKTFQDNVKFSNDWITSQIAAYDRSKDQTYKNYNREMLDGGGPEKGLGMRKWIAYRDNVSTWDNAVKSALGEDGYAKLVSLNAAFPASDLTHFRLIYGGERLYNKSNNTFTINGTTAFSNLKGDNYVEFKSADGKEYFNKLLALAGPVRNSIFQFYGDFKNGKVSKEKVMAFNKAYLITGGCALSSSDVVSNTLKANRYLMGLRYMANELGKLGYKVKM